MYNTSLLKKVRAEINKDYAKYEVIIECYNDNELGTHLTNDLSTTLETLAEINANWKEREAEVQDY